MSDRTKVKIALAEAITTQLWVKGLITQKQREKSITSARKPLERQVDNSLCSFAFGLDFLRVLWYLYPRLQWRG